MDEPPPSKFLLRCRWQLVHWNIFDRPTKLSFISSFYFKAMWAKPFCLFNQKFRCHTSKWWWLWQVHHDDPHLCHVWNWSWCSRQLWSCPSSSISHQSVHFSAKHTHATMNLVLSFIIAWIAATKQQIHHVVRMWFRKPEITEILSSLLTMSHHPWWLNCQTLIWDWAFTWVSNVIHGDEVGKLTRSSPMHLKPSIATHQCSKMNHKLANLSCASNI